MIRHSDISDACLMAFFPVAKHSRRHKLWPRTMVCNFYCFVAWVQSASFNLLRSCLLHLSWLLSPSLCCTNQRCSYFPPSLRRQSVQLQSAVILLIPPRPRWMVKQITGFHSNNRNLILWLTYPERSEQPGSRCWQRCSWLYGELSHREGAWQACSAEENLGNVKGH